MTRALRLGPLLISGVPPLQGDPHFRSVLAQRNLRPAWRWRPTSC
jgi:hypothetical protein